MGVRRTLALVVALVAVVAGGGSARATQLDGPVLTPPGNLAEPATTPCGSSLCGVVDYAFSVTGGTPPYTLSCNYPSGGLFPIGTYPVTCTATDATGATSPPASFTLTIGAPPTPPPSLTITAPGAMTIAASLPCPSNTSLECGIITYSFGISGGVPPYNLICNIPSGSFEPVGSYVIRCMGQDRAADSTPYQTFAVTITPSPVPPVESAPAGYVPDVTGCTISTCMANSPDYVNFDGLSCDLGGGFLWNRTSYSCANPSPATVTSPVTMHLTNDRSDVKLASITANGQPVSIASTVATGLDSGIEYTSVPIALQPGTNVITATTDDPIGRLPAIVYTWTIEYTAPATSSSTGSSGAPSSGSQASDGSSSATSSSPSTAKTHTSAAATTTTQLKSSSAAAPKIASTSGRQTFSFVLKLPIAATMQGTLATTAGRTLLRFNGREKTGRTVIKRSLTGAKITRGTRLTLRLTVRAGKATRALTIRFRA